MTMKPIVDLAAKRFPKRYYSLLICVLALTLLSPLVEHHLIGRVLVGVVAISSVVIATLAAQAGRKWSLAAVVLALFTAVAWLGSLLAPRFIGVSIHLHGLAYAITLCFVVTIILIMMKDIFTNEVTGNRVGGAICVYVLMGFSFAIIHMGVLLYDHTSYKDTSGDRLLDREGQIRATSDYPFFVYFSFCTLSTVGYGDVVPISHLARSVSWLEAITGQIYLTVLVARLVGLHIASSTSSTGSAPGKLASISVSASLASTEEPPPVGKDLVPDQS